LRKNFWSNNLWAVSGVQLGSQSGATQVARDPEDSQGLELILTTFGLVRKKKRRHSTFSA